MQLQPYVRPQLIYKVASKQGVSCGRRRNVGGTFAGLLASGAAYNGDGRLFAERAQRE